MAGSARHSASADHWWKMVTHYSLVIHQIGLVGTLCFHVNPNFKIPVPCTPPPVEGHKGYGVCHLHYTHGPSVKKLRSNTSDTQILTKIRIQVISAVCKPLNICKNSLVAFSGFLCMKAYDCRGIHAYFTATKTTSIINESHKTTIWKQQASTGLGPWPMPDRNHNSVDRCVIESVAKNRK